MLISTKFFHCILYKYMSLFLDFMIQMTLTKKIKCTLKTSIHFIFSFVLRSKSYPDPCQSVVGLQPAHYCHLCLETQYISEQLVVKTVLSGFCMIDRGDSSTYFCQWVFFWDVKNKAENINSMKHMHAVFKKYII